MNSRRGFTLIELLVVITIVAILAAILFPVLAQAKATAKRSVALTHARELGIATSMYMNDYEGQFPLAAYATDTSFVTWPDLVQPYVGSVELWWYPDSTVQKHDGSGQPTSHWGYNAHYLTNISYNFYNVAQHQAEAEGRVANPSETILFVNAKASVPGSWCGDDGKYLLPPSGASTDCWGRPDPVLQNRPTLLWLDLHANSSLASRFYEGQTPVDRFFDLG